MKTSTFIAALLLAGCGGGGGGGAPGATFATTPSSAAPVEKAPEPVQVPEAAPVAPPTQCRVVIFGDSIIADPLLTETIPDSIRRQRPGWQVDNYAVGGQNSRQGAPLVMNLTWKAGEVAVLEWGVNDSKLGTGLEAMESAAAFLKSQKVRPVITGLVRINGLLNRAYDAEARRIALATGSAFVSWGEREITTFDGTHPDQPSTDLLVEDLINTLDKECPQ